MRAICLRDHVTDEMRAAAPPDVLALIEAAEWEIVIGKITREPGMPLDRRIMPIALIPNAAAQEIARRWPVDSVAVVS
jgi:hypothetical protein